MKTPKWSDHHWFVIKQLIDNFNSENSEKTLETIIFLCLSLPCKICTTHFSEYLKKHPLNVSEKSELKNWFELYKKDLVSREQALKVNPRGLCMGCKGHTKKISHTKLVSSLR